jgi:multidrug efflux pump subunit AcrB
MKRSHEMAILSHYNIRRVIDIYGAVQGRDLGATSGDIARIVDRYRKALRRGTFITIRGQVDTMHKSYAGLIAGLAAAVVLVYMLIATLSVPALMGALMCVGVATANSILVVSFAKERLAEHGDAVNAAIEAGNTRFRPVIMTALAMIIGMVPMALGLGDGGEQNAPLGRAVIGGLLCATMATLVFVPSVFALFHWKSNPPENSLEDLGVRQR